MGVPRRALIAQDQKIPRAAVSEAFLVSSATCPLASKPVRTPEVKRNDSVQFQPVGAPVPLYVSRKKEASWKPYVCETPMGSQMRVSSQSSIMTAAVPKKTHRK